MIPSVSSGERALLKTIQAIHDYRVAVARGEDGEIERRSTHDILDAFFDHLAALIMEDHRG